MRQPCKLVGKRICLFVLSLLLLPPQTRSHADPNRGLKSKIHLNGDLDSTKLLSVRSALKGFGFKIKIGATATTNNHVMFGRPEKATIMGKIIEVRTSPCPSGISLLECVTEFTRDSPAIKDNWAFPVLIGIVWTDVNNGESWGGTAKLTTGGSRQLMRPRTTIGVGTPDSGTYTVTIVVLGQEKVDGPWYLLDSYFKTIDID